MGAGGRPPKKEMLPFFRWLMEECCGSNTIMDMSRFTGLSQQLLHKYAFEGAVPRKAMGEKLAAKCGITYRALIDGLLSDQELRAS